MKLLKSFEIKRVHAMAVLVYYFSVPIFWFVTFNKHKISGAGFICECLTPTVGRRFSRCNGCVSKMRAAMRQRLKLRFLVVTVTS